ncbi:MAG: TonB-dependent receptor [Verrucomicrobia bacterium]|nr:TonB-dependent receptor [Verrucomicrobiota bacterium]
MPEPKPNQSMEKQPVNIVQKSLRLALAGSTALFFVTNAFAQNPEATPGGRATGGAAAQGQPNAAVAPEPAAAAGAPANAGTEATAERVIVTGSNIPTAEEVGPNPVDTYRAEDVQKLGVVNQTDLLNRLPQEAGSTTNQNIANGGDGSVLVNLRGLLPKETLTLVDGKRVADPDLNLIPFPLIDHIDILKEGASAIYGADAVAGVFNVFLRHQFRGLEIGGTFGDTNLGASNDAREMEGWIMAGMGDDKTNIVVFADAYDRAAIYSADRDLTSNANATRFGGVDKRSSNLPGRVDGMWLNPNLIAPTPHSATNVANDPQYVPASAIALDDNLFRYNFAAQTPAIPASNRQTFYGSFDRDLCDKYLTVFADFKYSRSYFEAALAPTPFTPDPFRTAGSLTGFSTSGISVPITNPFNPFTVADATVQTPGGPVPVTTGVRYRSILQGVRFSPITKQDMLFDGGLKGSLGEFGDYFKNWNWELGFRYSRDEEEVQSRNVVSQPGLRDALLDTNPLTAFDPFTRGPQTKAAAAAVFVTLHASTDFELPLEYFQLNGDVFNLPAGPVGFAVGIDHRGERFRSDPDSLNTTFNTIGATDLEASKENRDVWGVYQEVRIPITSPTWNFPGAYSLEFSAAEREEWYSQNTSSTVAVPQGHSQFDAQKPRFEVRWQPFDNELTFRATYSETFHAPTLAEISPAGVQNFPQINDVAPPVGTGQKGIQIEEVLNGNPNLKPETAYEWTAGAVYSPRWLKGLTLSADWWNIDLRSVAATLGAQFIVEHESVFPTFVQRDPTTRDIRLVIDPLLNVSRVILNGLDFESVYILDLTNFGGPDVGQLTLTANGTYLSRYDFTPVPGGKTFNLAGKFNPSSFTFSGSLPRLRAYGSVFYHGPSSSMLNGFDTGAIVHYTGQYNDDMSTAIRKVREWTTLDLIGSYTFNAPTPQPEQQVAGYSKDGGKNVRTKDGKDKNVMPVSTASYSECGWRSWMNGTTLSLGMQNVFDSDPPFVAGAFENNYDESLADVRGRFWYVQLKKRF